MHYQPYRRFAVTLDVHLQLVAWNCEDWARGHSSSMRGEIWHLGDLPSASTSYRAYPASQSCLCWQIFKCVKCLKACNKFENYYCNMPDMNIIENVLSGHVLDTVSHFMLSLLPYSEKESYAFKFNLKVLNSWWNKTESTNCNARFVFVFSQKY